MVRILSLFVKRQYSMRGAAVVLVIMVFVSRILGLLRDRLLAAYFVPDELGVYFAAFRLPNLLFELLVMGALTSAFIPVFTKYITKEHEQEAYRIAATVINLTIILLVFISIPILLWTDHISRFLAPGFSEPEIALMAKFTRFMILFQVFPLMVGNFLTGILQSYKLFLIPALAPVIYNVGIIIAIIVFVSPFGLWAPVIGVGIGALLFVLIQVPLLFSLGYKHRFVLDFRHPGVKEVGKLMAPRTFGLAISQVDTTVDLMLASILGARMVTIFNFAQHLQQLPVGLFGMTVAQAALPSLSTSVAKQDMDNFKETLVSAIHQILFFILPASVLFIVLRIPVVRLVFGADRFDWTATVLTGTTLSFFSVSLFAQATSQVLTRGFYALYDSKTPVLVGIFSILINTGCSILFITYWHLPIWSLGLSTSIASIINMTMLFFLLDKKISYFSRYDLIITPLKMVFASLIMGVSLYMPLKIFDQLIFDTTRTFGLILLTGFTGSVGMFTYFFLSWVLGIGEFRSMVYLLRRVSKLKGILLEPATEVVERDI